MKQLFCGELKLIQEFESYFNGENSKGTKNQLQKLFKPHCEIKNLG
jgi:hypothetical protein